MLVGYARVSTKEQETRLQLDALRRAGVQLVFEEKASSVGDRPVLRACFESLSRGDVLVFWKMDRIARSLRDLLEFAELLSKRGVSLLLPFMYLLNVCSLIPSASATSRSKRMPHLAL